MAALSPGAQLIIRDLRDRSERIYCDKSFRNEEKTTMNDQRTMLTAASDRLDRLKGSFRKAQLVSNTETRTFVVPMFYFGAMGSHHWRHNIVGPKIIFDGSRYLVALLVAMVAYSVWR